MLKLETKAIMIFSLFILFALLVIAKGAEAAARTAASCSYWDVSTAISSSSAGDTIDVPAGNCTWNSTLSITKGINLIGKGINNTVITMAPNSDYNSKLTYSPSNKAANYAFRLSGFTFNCNDSSRVNESPCIYINNGDGPPQTKVRVDNNHIKNSRYTFSVQGIFGVADNNIFSNVRMPWRASWCGGGNGQYIWENYPELVFGKEDNNFYYEDNSVTDIYGGIVQDGQCGQRYVIRYNTLLFNEDLWPAFDMHGNYYFKDGPGGIARWYSTMGGEVYGNNLNFNGGNLFQQRGGKALWFYNNVNSVSSVAGGQVREERRDSESPLVNHPTWKQHVNDTYVWSNVKNYTTKLGDVSLYPSCCTASADCCEEGALGCNNDYTCHRHNDCCYNGIGQATLKPNIDYWMDRTDSFNGTSGVGCGTLASRPSTCTTGVGYWATNQFCSNLTGMVGANPANPINGTLFKCTSSNKWEEYYTPLTYPHPLRNVDSTLRLPPHRRD